MKGGRFDFGQAADDASFNDTDGMDEILKDEVPDLIIPAAMLPVVALLIIGLIFYGIKKVVDYTNEGETESDVRFEINLPKELIVDYEKIKDKYTSGELSLDEVKEGLQKRAFADLTCMFRLQNEAKSLRQAEIMGKLPNSLRDDFVAARNECEREINIVKAEAEDLEEGYGDSIMQWAAQAIQHTNKANQQKLKEHMESQMSLGMQMINEASKSDPSLAKLSDTEKRARVAQQIKIKQFIQHLKSRGLNPQQIQQELRRNNIRIVGPDGGAPPSPSGAVKKAE